MEKNYVELVGEVIYTKLYPGTKMNFQSVIIKVGEKVKEEVYYNNFVCKAFGKVTQPKITLGMTLNVIGSLKTEKDKNGEFKTFIIVKEFKSVKRELIPTADVSIEAQSF